MIRISLHFYYPTLPGPDPDTTPGRAFAADGGVPSRCARNGLLVGNHVRKELFYLLRGAADHGGSRSTGSYHLEEIPSFDSVGHELKP